MHSVIRKRFNIYRVNSVNKIIILHISHINVGRERALINVIITEFEIEIPFRTRAARWIGKSFPYICYFPYNQATPRAHIHTYVLQHKLRRHHARFYITVKPAYCVLFAIRAHVASEWNSRRVRKRNGIGMCGEKNDGKEFILCPLTL